MKRQEYIFTIGFSGNVAIVDGRAMKEYGSLSTSRLLEEGLYKPALASAFFNGDETEQLEVLKAFNSVAGSDFSRPLQLQRVFGLAAAPENIEKVRVLK